MTTIQLVPQKKAFFQDMNNITFSYGEGYKAFDIYNVDNYNSDIVYVELFLNVAYASNQTVHIHFNYKTLELVKIKLVGTGSRRNQETKKQHAEAFFNKVIIPTIIERYHEKAIVMNYDYNKQVNEVAASIEVNEVTSNKQEETTSYNVGNRAFNTHKEAVTYCDSVDYEYNMIEESKQTEPTHNMNTVTINPLSDSFNTHMMEAYSKGYTVVCAQRPLNGLQTWQGNSLGNGIYFAYGNMSDYAKGWEFLDASIVTIQTNEDIIKLITNMCIEEGTTIEEVLQDSTMKEIAESLELNYINQSDNVLPETLKIIEAHNTGLLSNNDMNESIKQSEVVTTIEYDENETYHLYKNTFSTYKEAYNYSLKYNIPDTMIISSNHPTMTNERLQELEKEYVFSKHKMSYDNMKEYFNYISVLPVSLDQEERYYKLRDWINRYEYKEHTKKEREEKQHKENIDTAKRLSFMVSKGLIIKHATKNYGFTEYYFNGSKVWSWYSGISTIKYNEAIHNIFNQYFSQYENEYQTNYTLYEYELSQPYNIDMNLNELEGCIYIDNKSSINGTVVTNRKLTSQELNEYKLITNKAVSA
ncbi:hypothetical protein BAOM_3087 [Peribacillus asahii]|uniref:Uncharacterized protein n=1 Tax=Peribacillus asahii TaxID=228899 RepID=A0A3Q9RNM6_9BACI|nr:hypothetical protein [Peribacillus asahii]AZV43696.1 hypothetical protein BAOM_3087 [Peribacillus asahii]